MAKSKFPTVGISGGLGNQLFQWFAAHLFFETKGFNLDLGHFDINPEREFELSPLIEKCSHKLNKESATKKFPAMKIFGQFASRGIRPNLLEKFGYIQEIAHPEDLSAVLENHSKKRLPLYLNGLFQNGDMVNQIFPSVRHELMSVVDENFKSIQAKFALPELFAAIHVRRGDYPTSSLPSKAIGQLDDVYYSELASKTELPIILLTENTSDIKELSTALKPSLILSQHEADAWQCLSIMANSKFLVGSNSSLSWWGAYLATLEKKEAWLPKGWSQWGNYQPIAFNSSPIKTSQSKWRLS